MFVGLWLWWVWWVFIEESVGHWMRHGALLCYWFAMGLIQKELVEEGREEMAKHRVRERQSIGTPSIV